MRPGLLETVLVKNTMAQVAEELESKNLNGSGDKKDGQDYFASYNDVEVHRLMLQDKPRTEAYQKAILENAFLFKDKTVMDIGAGTGILSLFAMKAGAKKVYAVEASSLATQLSCIVEKNDPNGVIEVIQGKAEDIDLPDNRKVDIIISEWMGFYLLHESMLDSVIKAREKHLDDDGCMFPSHATILAAPVKLDSFMRDNVEFWQDVYGFDMSAMAQMVVEHRLSGGSPEIMTIEEDNLLAEPCVVTEFDLRWVQLDETRAVRDRKFVSINKDGNFHGLAIWFEVKFEPMFYEEEISQAFRPVTLSTSPSCPPTHWKQTIIVVPGADVDVEKDEVVGWEINMEQSEENCRHYQLGLTILDPSAEEHPVPCYCKMARCALFAAIMKKEEEDIEEMNVQNGSS